MFEEEAHELDILIAAEGVLKNDSSICSEKYHEFMSKQKQLSDLQSSIFNLDEQMQLVNDAMTMATLNNPENVENIKSIYFPQLDFLKKRKKEMVRIS